MKLNSLQELKVLSNNASEYRGRLSNYQTEGSTQNGKRYARAEHIHFTEYQKRLYNRAIFGLSVYSKHEIKNMHSHKRKRIVKVNKKAQSSINILKQEKVNKLCDRIYNVLFPKSKLAKKMLSLQEVDTDPTYINNLDLKSLRITRRCIADRFIQDGVLPKNFYDLKKMV